MKPPVVIPAYQPGPELEKLVKVLLADGQTEVILVDDGSSTEHNGAFLALSKLPRVRLLRHETNRGKGQALKTAFNHFLTSFPETSPGVVTADADGQHLPEDIAAVSRRLSENGGALYLGTRRFKGVVPAKSLFGNTLTRLVFRVFSGRAVSDTQTGLRGIPRAFLTDLIKVRANGYAFELEMLLLAVRSGMKITEIPIETVYMKGNAGSHFRPLLDSVRIYYVFLRFAASALAARFSRQERS
jgi:dolichol-phosphate mannosyltransferase